MGRAFYCLLRVLQLQQERADLDYLQPVPGSRERPRKWSTILMGAGIFAAVFGAIVTALLIAPMAGGLLLLAGGVAFLVGMLLMIVEVVIELRR